MPDPQTVPLRPLVINKVVNVRGRADSSMLLIRAWTFWCSAPIREPSRSPLRVASLEQNMFLVLLSLGIYKGFRSPVSGTGDRNLCVCVCVCVCIICFFPLSHRMNLEHSVVPNCINTYSFSSDVCLINNLEDSHGMCVSQCSPEKRTQW